jgi:proline iminopeptidase
MQVILLTLSLQPGDWNSIPALREFVFVVLQFKWKNSYKIDMLKNAAKLFLLWVLSVQSGCTVTQRTPSPLPQAKEGYVEAGNGVKLFYRLLGSGPDTLIMIHGGPGLTMDYFLDDLAPLAAHHTLLFYDQRGTGRSTLVSDSMSLDAQRFVEDVEAIRKHFGIGRLTLLGHSWGSAVVALYAMSYPEYLRRIIIVVALPLQQYQLTDAFKQLEMKRDSSTLKRMRELRAARLADPGNSEVCSAYYTLWFQPFYGNRGTANRSKGDFCAGTLESRRNKMASVDKFTMSSLGQWDWRSSLSQVKVPALVIHGTMDPLPLDGAKAWASVMQNDQLLLLDGVGHFPYVEVPDRFFEAVNLFLKRT